MNQKSNENFDVLSSPHKMTTKSLGLAVPGCKVLCSCWAIVAVAMLLPQSLGHFGVGWSPCGGNHTCPRGPLPVWSNFIFWGFAGNISAYHSSVLAWCVCELSQHGSSSKFHQYGKGLDFPLAKSQELELSLLFL